MDKDWFGPHVGPYAAVSTYRNATPQGMTNAPHTEKVKEKLLRDIVDYGVKFDHDSWPPPPPPKETEHSVLATRTPFRRAMSWSTNALLSLEEQRAGNHVTIGKRPAHIIEKWSQDNPANNISNVPPRRATSAPNMKSSSKGKEVKKKGPPPNPENKLIVALTRVRLAAGRATKPLPAVFKALDPEGRAFVARDVFLQVMKSLKCSLSPEDCQLLANEFAPPTQPDWVCYIHFLRRLTPQQVALRKESMLSQSKRAGSADDEENADDNHPTSSAHIGNEKDGQSTKRRGSRNALLDGEQPRVRFGDVETELIGKDPKQAGAHGSSGGRQSLKDSSAHKGLAFKGAKGQGKGGGDKDSKKSAPEDIRKQGRGLASQGFIDEADLQNEIAGLRSLGRLHNAAVQDQHRYRADPTAGGSMVLVGAGAAPNPQGRWACDVAELTSFHNSAMRTVNPSGLYMLKEPPKRRKKKDEDELQLSDSGLFYARYPASEPLKALKTLRRKHFAEEDTVTKEQKIANDLFTAMRNVPFDEQQRGV